MRAVGYAFQNKGSTTSPDGYTGYYDTTLRDGTQVFPSAPRRRRPRTESTESTESIRVDPCRAETGRPSAGRNNRRHRRRGAPALSGTAPPSRSIQVARGAPPSPPRGQPSQGAASQH